MDRERAYTTLVVSKRDAAGYVYAGLIRGAKVDVHNPLTPDETEKAVAAHVMTLLCEHQPPDDEKDDFVATARQEVRAAFDDPGDPAVLVGIHTFAGDAGVVQAQAIAELATLYDPQSN